MGSADNNQFFSSNAGYTCYCDLQEEVPRLRGLLREEGVRRTFGIEPNALTIRG